MMYTCISLIVHPPFEIPGSAPDNTLASKMYPFINYRDSIHYWQLS